MSIKGADIRNIAVIGHSGEGKTSVCEAILFNGKATDRLGKVTEGTTVTDSDEQEIARKMSISLGVAYAMWEGVKLNLLDVPAFTTSRGGKRGAARRGRRAHRDGRDGHALRRGGKGDRQVPEKQDTDGRVHQRRR